MNNDDHAAELGRTRATLEEVLSAAELGFWTWDIQKDCLVGDAKLAFLFGIDEQAAARGTSAEVLLRRIEPQDEPMIRAELAHVLAAGGTYAMEHRVRGSDGKLRWISARGRAQLDERKQAQSLNGIVQDITERKIADQERAQAEIRLTEQARLSALGADIGRALTQVADLREALQKCTEAMVVHLNAAFARIWTLSGKEDVLELQASAGLYTHIDGGHARIPVGSFKIGRIAQQRTPHLTNSVVSDPDVSDQEWAQKEGMVAFAGYPLVVENRLIGVSGLFARRPLGEEALTALASVSATIAIAIERKRASEELARHLEELRRSNEDLEQFAHVASHDLRSPTRTVLQFTEMIMRRQGASLDAEMKQFLLLIRDSAKRMDDLVSALLNYARLSDADSARAQPVSSLAAYEGAVANLQATITESRAEIVRGDLPEVLSNSPQLCQVFQNLISNAIHYRGETLPVVRVAAERQTNHWMFSVTDNGPGISAKYHAQIFEPFKRLHGAERPGSGIGLAFCRKFIEREGGRIWVESEEGKGASFRFTLPAVQARL